MKKRNIYQNQSQEIVNLFEAAGSNEKVMCVPMDYAKKDHLVMFCNGHGDILRKPFSVKNTPEGIAYTILPNGVLALINRIASSIGQNK